MLVVIMGIVDLLAALMLALNADYIGWGIVLWVVVMVLVIKGLTSLLGIFGGG
ncbi:MAG: hypothetical protein QXD77_01090 [Candidatus Aenigmatarchaeota archaeon]